MMISDSSKNPSFPFSEISGAIHLHTRYSDGGTGYEELISAAQSLKLDYLVVTDHMSLGGLENGYEGLYGNVKVIVGYEHNDSQNLNHYLAIGSNKVFSEADKPKQYIDLVKKAGGIGFLAHPAEKRHYFGNLPPYPWTEWQVSGYDGIEIWNQMSDWMEQLKSFFSIVRLMYPRRFIGEVPPELLCKWDALNRERFVSGIGGVDAHTRRLGKGIFSMVVFPIKVELKGIRTHLYVDKPLNDFAIAKHEIIQALKDGRGFISNYRRGDARGTKMFVEYADGSVSLPGRPPLLTKIPAIIHAEFPENGKISILENSNEIYTEFGKKASFHISRPGIYRIEVYRKSKAWIYSNPFPIGTYPIPAVKIPQV